MSETTKKSNETTKATPDYEKLYLTECSKTKALELKVEELTKICKSLSEQNNKLQNDLQNAALEYNARTEYMLDAVKHTYISIQFAKNTPTTGGNV